MVALGRWCVHTDNPSKARPPVRWSCLGRSSCLPAPSRCTGGVPGRLSVYAWKLPRKESFHFVRGGGTRTRMPPAWRLSLCRTGLVLPQRREGQCSALGGATRLHLPSRPVLHSMQNDCWLPWQQRASNPGPSKVMVAVRACVHAGAYLALVVAADRVQIIHLPKPLQPFRVSPAASIRRCLSRRNVSRCRAWSLIVARMNTCHRRMFWCCRHSASRLRLQLESATKTISMVQFSPDSESLAVVLYNEMQVKSFP